MESIVTENNGTATEEGPTTQIQIQVSGTGETQLVTLPLSMATAISNQGNVQNAAPQHDNTHNAQDPAKTRREQLSRRPSYRKILNELSGQPENRSVKEEVGDSKSSDSSESDSGGQVTSVPPPTLAYHNATGSVTVQQPTIQIAAPALNHDQQNSVTSVAGIQTFSMANALAQGQATLVQGEGTAPGNTLWMPTNHAVVVQGDNQMYQIRPPTSGSSIPGVVMAGATTMQSPQQMAEEASRKRELRLMKNREAAKECRRRKKEYVKCLETRVTVLENQNKQLIDELKTLKELYVHKQVD